MKLEDLKVGSIVSYPEGIDGHTDARVTHICAPKVIIEVFGTSASVEVHPSELER